MAKVAFSKLDLKKNQEVTNLQINDEISIEIKQYLPVGEKLKMISEIVNLSQGDSNIVNYGKIDIFTLLGIITYYTNINFTEKQMEDPAKLYDLFVGNGLSIDILKAIPRSEIDFISNVVERTAENIIQYRNSAVGIVEAISQDYSNLNFDATELQKKIGDPENLAFLKDVLTKLG